MNVKCGGARTDSLGDKEKLQNRLEPYNNIAVIATLLAGYVLRGSSPEEPCDKRFFSSPSTVQ